MLVFPRPRLTWRLRQSSLSLGDHTVLMGILNCTPDSFSDGGSHTSIDDAVRHGLSMLDQGAEILDLGAESTRPGATPLDTMTEQERLLPVLQRLRQLRPHALLSVDTYHAATASIALQYGADIINDVSGLLWDPEMASVLAETLPQPSLVLMHARGTPATWSDLAPLAPGEETELVHAELLRQINIATAAGISFETILLDPGFGFGKRGDENISLLARVHALHSLHRPILIGLSRKGFLSPPLEASARRGNAALSEARLHATSAAHTAAILAGAHLLRVHDVPTAAAVASLADRLQRAAWT